MIVLSFGDPWYSVNLKHSEIICFSHFALSNFLFLDPFALVWQEWWIGQFSGTGAIRRRDWFPYLWICRVLRS
jgi:hypothetical protein